MPHNIYSIIILVIKVRKGIIMFFLVGLCMCGCEKNNQYDNFEHYDLTNYDTTNSYTYVGENNQKYEYIVTDITPAISEERIEGLFYKVSDNDYILLDKINSCTSAEAYNSSKQTYFYDNKLYVNRCSGGVVLEYTLAGSETSKTDLLLKLDSSYMLTSINSVDEENIYYDGSASISSPTEIIKCSRKDYKCEQ